MCNFVWQQEKLREGINSSEQAMAHRVDVKIEEIRSEIKFLKGAISWVDVESRSAFKSIQKSPFYVCSFDRETRSHSLIDKMGKKLEQTNKKLDDVKRKCNESVKQCLQVQLENVSGKFVWKGRVGAFGFGVMQANQHRAIEFPFDQLTVDILWNVSPKTMSRNSPVRR